MRSNKVSCLVPHSSVAPDSEPASREWPTARDHTKFWIPTNQRRQKLDPNQSDRWNSKGPPLSVTLQSLAPDREATKGGNFQAGN